MYMDNNMTPKAEELFQKAMTAAAPVRKQRQVAQGAVIGLSASDIKGMVGRAYIARRDRKVNPEGNFDKQKRWYPSEREDAEGSGSNVRSPSAAWPFSYMLRCRTRKHVANLVQRGLQGLDVPPDIAQVIARG